MKKIFAGLTAFLTALTMTASVITLAEGETPADPAGNEAADPAVPAAPTANKNGFSSDSTADLVLTHVNVGDTFNAYKIIEVTYNAVTNTISYDWADKIKNGIKQANNNVELTVAQYMDLGAQGRKEILSKLHQYINTENIPTAGTETGVAGASETDPNTATFSQLPLGGYLISANTSTDVYEMIFKAVEPQTDADGEYKLDGITFKVQAKHKPVSIVKTADKASAMTNEDITYYIVADVPAYGANAVDKYFQIDDVLPPGLVLDVNSIYVYGSESENAPTNSVATGWEQRTAGETYTLSFDGTLPADAPEGSSMFTVTVKNEADGVQQFDEWYKYTVEENGAYTSVASYKKIMITYTAKLDDKAKIAKSTVGDDSVSTERNTNKAILTYYPYPYIKDSENQIETKKKEATYSVYTYGLDIYKFTTQGEEGETALAGAKFQLFSDATAETVLTGYYYKDRTHPTWALAGEDTLLETDSNGYIQVKGLAGDASYWFKEIAAPSGYNLPQNPISEFKTTTQKDSAALDDITNTDDDYSEKALAGYVLKKVENNKGFTLPSTGGAGILFLKVFGVVAMAAAVVVGSVFAFRPRKKEQN